MSAPRYRFRRTVRPLDAQVKSAQHAGAQPRDPGQRGPPWCALHTTPSPATCARACITQFLRSGRIVPRAARGGYGRLVVQGGLCLLRPHERWAVAGHGLEVAVADGRAALELHDARGEALRRLGDRHPRFGTARLDEGSAQGERRPLLAQLGLARATRRGLLIYGGDAPGRVGGFPAYSWRWLAEVAELHMSSEQAPG